MSKFFSHFALSLVLFVFVISTIGCKKSEAIITVSTEIEANEIIDTLEENSIEANKEAFGEERDKKWKILVIEDSFGSGKATRAIQILQDNGLPHPSGIGLGEEVESGLGLSPMGEENKKTKQLKIEIERQLRILPGVVKVGVNIVLPQEDTLKLNPYPAKASVLIVHKNKEPLFTINQVQTLVTGGIPNLLPENVSVTAYYQAPRNLVPIANPNEKIYKILIIGMIFLIIVAVLVIVVLIVNRRQKTRNNTEIEPIQNNLQNSGEE